MIDAFDSLADIRFAREASQRPPVEMQQMQPSAQTQLQMVSPEAGLQSIVPGQILDENGLPVSPSPADTVNQVTQIAGQYAMANPQKTAPFAAALAAFGAGSEAANMIDKRVEAESEKENLDAVKSVATSLPYRTGNGMSTMPRPVQEEIQVSEASPMQAGLASVMPMQAGGRPDIPDIQGIKNKTEFQNQLNSVIADQTIDPAVKRLLPFWTREEGFLTTTKSAIEDGTTKDIGFGHKLTNQERKSKRVYGIDISKPLSTENALKIAVKDLEGGLKQIQNNITKMKKNKLLPENVQSYDQLNINQKAALLDIQKNVKKGIVGYPKFTKAVLTGDSNLANEEHERFFEKDDKFVLMKKRNKAFVKEFPSIFMSKENKTRNDLQELASLEQTSMETPNIYKQYTVKEGDNLTTIANKLGTTLEEIRNVNDDITLANQDNISINQKINIPGMENDSFIRDVPEQPQDQSILDTIKSYGSEGISTVREFFGLREGGDIGEYFEGQVEGKGDGMSDEIPFQVEGGNPDFALLSKDEYVIPADVVAMLGNGSSNAGSDKLDDFLEDTREEAFGRKEQQTQIDAEKGLSSLA